MAMILIPRLPALYFAATGAVVVLHAYLCYPAAIARGHPPIAPFHLISVFLAPLAMLLPPFFDDARNRTMLRWLRAGFVGVAFAVVWAVVDFNLRTPVPHAGHWGLVGMVRANGGLMIINALCMCVVSVPFFYCLDGLAIGLWSLIRAFPDAPQQKIARPPDVLVPPVAAR